MKNFITHSGLFHADELGAFVVAVLSGQTQPSKLIRLTDISPENINSQKGIIADIGREYKPEKDRFDHHQGLILRKNGVPYASFGLMWKHYGHLIEPDAEVRERVDKVFIQGIDANDADSEYYAEGYCSAGEVRLTTLPGIISSMNTSDLKDQEAQKAAFLKAAVIIEMCLENAIEGAKRFVEANKKFAHIAKVEGEIITLSEFVPWKEIVYESYTDAKFVVSPSAHPGNPFSLLAVPIKPGRRDLKIPIERPEWFEGFIHQGKFIAGCQSLEEAVMLAKSNLNLMPR